MSSLGSVGVPQSPAGRIEYWTKLHQRLAALGNRINGTMHTDILTAIHARIPMPTQDDQRAVQLENAREEVRIWNAMRDMQIAEIEDRKEAAASMEQSIAERKPAADAAVVRGKAAKERLESVERGEDVVYICKPLGYTDLLSALGWTRSDARHARRLAEIDRQEGAWAELMANIGKRHRSAEKAASRAILKKRQQPR